MTTLRCSLLLIGWLCFVALGIVSNYHPPTAYVLFIVGLVCVLSAGLLLLFISVVECTVQQKLARRPLHASILQKTIVREWQARFHNTQYIRKTEDAQRFLDHLVFLATDGELGEYNPFLARE